MYVRKYITFYAAENFTKVITTIHTHFIGNFVFVQRFCFAYSNHPEVRTILYSSTSTRWSLCNALFFLFSSCLCFSRLQLFSIAIILITRTSYNNWLWKTFEHFSSQTVIKTYTNIIFNCIVRYFEYLKLQLLNTHQQNDAVNSLYNVWYFIV